MIVREDEVKVHIGRLVFNNHKDSKLFEEDLRVLLESHRLRIWASGKDMTTGVRDIAYEKNASNEEPDDD